MNRQEVIDQLIQDTQLVKEDVLAMSGLSLDILRRQPEDDRWSVLQCLEHLNISDEHYLIQFDRKLNKAAKSNSHKFSPGILGKVFYKMMKPKENGDIPSPMKTFEKFQPAVNIQLDTLEKFVSDQDVLISYLEKARELDLNKNKISSAIGSIIMFKLGDAFRFLIAHNQRHVVQMKNVLKAIGEDVHAL